MTSKPLATFVKRLNSGDRVLDYGSYNFMLAEYCAAQDLGLSIDACDILKPDSIPNSIANFIQLDPASTTLPIAEKTYDAIVASHVLEHIVEPLKTVRELLRLLKPGGLLYLETPSELSLKPTSGRKYWKHGFFSFWDDPTHIRPWTVAALYRVAMGYACEMREGDYIGTIWDKIMYPFIGVWCFFSGDHHRLTDAAWRAGKFSCYAIVKRPEILQTIPEFRYMSFKKITATS